MPAINDEELLDDLTHQISPTIAEEVPTENPYDMGTNVIISKNTQQSNIIQNLRGYKWNVDYFNNLSGVNDITNAGSEVLDESIQKYNKFEDLIIYLESPLQIGDLENLTGTGTINAFIVPKIGDHFKATMVDNRVGIFIVTEVKNLTYQDHEVYDITFKFHTFADSDESLSNNLEEKVIESYAYDKDHIGDNGTPVILKSELKNKLKLKDHIKKLSSMYFSLFTDRESLFLNPYGRNPDKTSDLMLVDNLLNKFINKTVEDVMFGHKNRLKDFDYVQNPEFYKSIWDALIEQDEDYLFNIQHNLGWTAIERTGSTPASRNLYYLGVNGVVDLMTIDEFIIDTMNKQRLFERPNAPEGLEVKYPLLLEDDKLEFYVFDRCFYIEDLDKITPFQSLVKRFIKKEIITTEELEEYINHWRYWSKYEQYYIIPVLLLLMKYCTKTKFRER